MTAELGPARRSWRKRLTSHPYTTAILVVLAVLVVPVVRRHQSDFASVYLPAAERLARGQDIYQQGYVYPPVDAWAVLPFTVLSPGAARVLWLALNGAALVILVWGAWRLSGGSRLEGSPGAPWREHLIFGLGMLSAFAYLVDALTSQQSDLLVAALAILGCQALASRGARRRADVRAGSRPEVHASALGRLSRLAAALAGRSPRRGRCPRRQSPARPDAPAAPWKPAPRGLGPTLPQAHGKQEL